VNDPPSLLLEDLTLYLDENSGLHLVGFEVSASEAVTFDVTTTNSAMFRNLGVDYEGSGLGDIVFETATNARGTATIIVTAYAGSLTTSQTITVTVEERNDPPTMNATDTQVIDVNSGPHSLLLSGITAGIGENGPVKVSIVGITPNNFFSSIAIGSAPAGSDPTDRLLSFTPAAGIAGGGSVTLEVRDAGPDNLFNTADDESLIHRVEVHATSNKAPTLAAVASQRFAVGGGPTSIPLTGIGDGGNNTQSLRFEVASTNQNVANLYVGYDEAANANTGSLFVIPSAVGSAIITLNVTDPGDDGVFDTYDDRTTTRTIPLEIVTALNHWHNFENRYDVNKDGNVTPLDILLVINYLAQFSIGPLPERTVGESPYVDVNDDEFVSNIDILQVINEINRGSRISNGEGEQVVKRSVASISSPNSSANSLATPKIETINSGISAEESVASTASLADQAMAEESFSNWSNDVNCEAELYSLDANTSELDEPIERRKKKLDLTNEIDVDLAISDLLTNGGLS
jgi:hypothetical protein